MKYKYAIFDFDGTVADTGEGVIACVMYAMESFGIEIPSEEKLMKFLGPPLVVSFLEYTGGDMKKAEEMTEKYRELYSDNAMYLVKLFDGMRELLRKLKNEGIKIGIASSKPQIYIDRLLGYLDISEYFDAVCGESTDDRGNGKKELILRACELLGVKDKKEAVMIGDRHYDIDGAKEAGTDSIGVTFGFGNEKELKEAGATFIASAPEEIIEYI